MARTGSGIGYTPSQTSTSMPGSFDEEQMAIARRRLMLQQLANEPAVDSGYKGAHWVNPYAAQIGPAITQMMSHLEQPKLDAQLQDIAKRRGEYADQLMSNPPQMVDQPAVPGQEGTGPIAPPPDTPGVEQDAYQPGRDIAFQQTQQGLGAGAAAGGETGAPTMLPVDAMAQGPSPMVPQPYAEFQPNVADQPMVPKWDDAKTLKWASNLASASPMHAKIAEKFIDSTLAAPEKAAIRAEKAAAEMEKVKEQTRAKVEAAQATQEGRQYMQQLGFNQQEYLAKLKGNDHEYFIRLAAALKPEKTTPVEHTTLQGYDVDTGRPVNRKADGSLVRLGEDGKPEATPFTGETIPAAAKEKEIAAVRTAMVHKAGVDNLLRMAETNEGAFGSSGALLGVIPGPAGTWVSSANLTPEQRKARSDFATEAARITHDLYGSAFTTGEQTRAKQFIVDALDPPEVVLSKMQSMKAAADRSELFQSNVAKNAVRARMGKGAAPAGGAPKQIKDAAEFNALPSGTTFVDPSGVTRKKP